MSFPGARASDDAVTELVHALANFPPMASPHEGYAILKEKVDELWDEIKGNHPEREVRMRAEAVQVAAMALRFIEDVCDKGET